MQKILAELEQIAERAGAALVYADHFSKGNQAGKKAIDRISGSGVTARDPDAIVTITELEDEGGGCLYEHSRQKSHTASNPTNEQRNQTASEDHHS